MSHNGFQAILTFLYFNDNSKDRLYYIRPMLDRLADKFSTFYTPQQNVALDESTLAWTGRPTFRVYNPGKIQENTKYGILVHMVCEPDSGHICKLMIYNTAGITLQNTVPVPLSSYLGQGYKVYMDNY
jgi:hypothetical protein